VAGKYVALPREVLKWGLSLPSAVGYVLMLDRVGLSRRNDWVDEKGRPYIYYSLASLSRDLGVSETTVRKVLDELEKKGLLRREGRPGKASRLYLYTPLPEAEGGPTHRPAGETGGGRRDLSPAGEIGAGRSVRKPAGRPGADRETGRKRKNWTEGDLEQVAELYAGPDPGGSCGGEVRGICGGGPQNVGG